MIEPLILPEMCAAGIEAWREARAKRLSEGDTVNEIYLAMYGESIRACAERPETVQ